MMSNGIYALASGYGKSAIAVVRITKKNVLLDISKFINKKNIKPRYATLVNLYKDKEKINLIDNCILLYFEGNRSYCGIDTIELYLHGSLFIIKEVFNLLDSIGYREAEPGEFTKLALINGKIDLIQAEAINNLINSENQKAYENSLKNLDKEFSNRLKIYEEKILNISSFFEASLEYPEDDFEVDEGYLKRIEDDFDFLIDEISNILKNSDSSIRLHSKFNVVIAGPTNSGKSSLFNTFLKEDRSIVSDIHGTTRDYIESELTLGNLHISIFDTAGIRDSEDKIEKIGIQRVNKLISEADIIIFLLSVDCILDKKLLELFENNKSKIIVALNKIDLLFTKDEILKTKNIEKTKKNQDIEKVIGKMKELKLTERVFEEFLLENHNNIIPISIEMNYNIDLIEKMLKDKLEKSYEQSKDEDESYFFIQTIRQKVLIEQVLKYIKDAQVAYKNKGLYDISAECLKNAYLKINELTGKEYTEELLESIFSKFCLGK